MSVLIKKCHYFSRMKDLLDIAKNSQIKIKAEPQDQLFYVPPSQTLRTSSQVSAEEASSAFSSQSSNRPAVSTSQSSLSQSQESKQGSQLSHEHYARRDSAGVASLEPLSPLGTGLNLDSVNSALQESKIGNSPGNQVDSRAQLQRRQSSGVPPQCVIGTSPLQRHKSLGNLLGESLNDETKSATSQYAEKSGKSIKIKVENQDESCVTNTVLEPNHAFSTSDIPASGIRTSQPQLKSQIHQSQASGSNESVPRNFDDLPQNGSNQGFSNSSVSNLSTTPLSVPASQASESTLNINEVGGSVLASSLLVACADAQFLEVMPVSAPGSQVPASLPSTSIPKHSASSKASPSVILPSASISTSRVRSSIASLKTPAPPKHIPASIPTSYDGPSIPSLGAKYNAMLKSLMPVMPLHGTQSMAQENLTSVAEQAGVLTKSQPSSRSTLKQDSVTFPLNSKATQVLARDAATSKVAQCSVMVTSSHKEAQSIATRTPSLMKVDRDSVTASSSSIVPQDEVTTSKMSQASVTDTATSKIATSFATPNPSAKIAEIPLAVTPSSKVTQNTVSVTPIIASQIKTPTKTPVKTSTKAAAKVTLIQPNLTEVGAEFIISSSSDESGNTSDESTDTNEGDDSSSEDEKPFNALLKRARPIESANTLLPTLQGSEPKKIKLDQKSTPATVTKIKLEKPHEPTQLKTAKKTNTIAKSHVSLTKSKPVLKAAPKVEKKKSVTLIKSESDSSSSDSDSVGDPSEIEASQRGSESSGDSSESDSIIEIKKEGASKLVKHSSRPSIVASFKSKVTKAIKSKQPAQQSKRSATSVSTKLNAPSEPATKPTDPRPQKTKPTSHTSKAAAPVASKQPISSDSTLLPKSAILKLLKEKSRIQNAQSLKALDTREKVELEDLKCQRELEDLNVRQQRELEDSNRKKRRDLEDLKRQHALKVERLKVEAKQKESVFNIDVQAKYVQAMLAAYSSTSSSSSTSASASASTSQIEEILNMATKLFDS